MVAELLENLETSGEKKSGAPGTDIVVKGRGLGKGVKTVGVFGPAGILSAPPKGARMVALPCGEGRRLMYVVACKNYQLNITLDGGETTIISTSYDGKTVKARIDLKADGTIEINGNSKRLVTWDELNSALSTLCATITSHVHASNGTPSPGLVGLSCNISAAKTTTVKTGG